MTFADLVFEPHSASHDGKHGKLFFPNGYGVSVIQTDFSYTSGPDEYELAVVKGSEEKYNLCYSTDITDDVLGHLSPDEVTSIIQRVEALP